MPVTAALPLSFHFIARSTFCWAGGEQDRDGWSRGAGLDDEHRRRRATAADVQGRGPAGAFDLDRAGLASDLVSSVEQHTYAGRADRVAESEQATGRVDGQGTGRLDGAVVDD